MAGGLGCVSGGVVLSVALLQGYSDQVGVASDPESHCCILSEKLVCAAAGSGSSAGSLGGGGQVVGWPVGAVAQAVSKSSSMAAVEVGNFTGLLLSDAVGGELSGRAHHGRVG